MRDTLACRRGAMLGAMALLAGCNLPQPPEARLPAPGGGVVLLDPARHAIFNTAHAFAASAPMAGRPWDTAQAISELEFLTVELRWNLRWTEMSPLAVMAFEQARPEWRGALGIAADAPPQAVIDALTRVRIAYAMQDQAMAAAALAPPLFTPGGAAALERLGALPRLPMTARAARLAEQELWRIQREGNNSQDWT
ncbi:hypothetical protein J5Y09_05660 [Roseomonas sp. PWR1]|uniref:Uncharacterized protein n=1 Tax=Roseomonas nitratireducens TaxID=2820810 RepID=A0ABS4APU7_9PROT|nr:hypothetical protein [Neoroseomonas nitratireducens]MBP0463390.1 hypothetical protein [Neoroseomonas nitratireducens]